jgi:dTDP-4-amino-4,6-dideoxygalactose transaminase
MAPIQSSRDSSPGVPLLDLNRQYEGLRQEVLAAIERVCASQQFVLGQEVEALEGELSGFVGAAYGVGCGSGTDALWLALAAAGIGPGDRVITTPFSFFASASAIVRAGAEPVFVDVAPGTLNLDPAKVRQGLEAVKERESNAIKAVLPVHLYGQCADMDAFQQIATDHNLVLIEDAAQAIGAKWDGKGAGSIGTAAAFSFYPTKNLSAYGDGGMVTTSDPGFAEHMRRLRNHGSPERYLHTEFGWNARMDGIQAAVLRVKLKHISEWSQLRREHAEVYDRLLRSSGLLSERSTTSEHSPVQPLQISPLAFHVFHQYVVRAQRRDQLKRFLAKRGIGSEVYYPIPLHLQPVFAYLGYKEGDLPESERASKEVLALPMFPELREEEQQRVVAAIAEFYG